MGLTRCYKTEGFVTMRAFDRRTDGLADRILIPRPHLQSMQRGN